MKNATKKRDRVQEQRRGLLAKVHIAIKDLDIPDGDYRDILRNEFFVESSGALSIDELQRLVRRFEGCGWKSKGRRSTQRDADNQVEALKERVGQMVLHSELDMKRFRGLVKKICGVEDIKFVRDVGKLKRLLAVLGKISHRPTQTDTDAGMKD